MKSRVVLTGGSLRDVNFIRLVFKRDRNIQCVVINIILGCSKIFCRIWRRLFVRRSILTDSCRIGIGKYPWSCRSEVWRRCQWGMRWWNLESCWTQTTNTSWLTCRSSRRLWHYIWLKEEAKKGWQEGGPELHNEW